MNMHPVHSITDDNSH